MNVKICGKQKELIELQLQNLRPSHGMAEPFETEIHVQIQSGSWKSSYFSQYVQTKNLISFLRDLKSLVSLSHETAQLQDSDDLLFIRVALSKNKEEIWIYGHAKEVDHKNELRFSFESNPVLMTTLLNQIDDLQLAES